MHAANKGIKITVLKFLGRDDGGVYIKMKQLTYVNGMHNHGDNSCIMIHHLGNQSNLLLGMFVLCI